MNEREWEDWCLELEELSLKIRQWVDSSQSRLGVDDLVVKECKTMHIRATAVMHLREAAQSLESAASALSG